MKRLNIAIIIVATIFVINGVIATVNTYLSGSYYVYTVVRMDTVDAYKIIRENLEVGLPKFYPGYWGDIPEEKLKQVLGTHKARAEKMNAIERTICWARSQYDVASSIIYITIVLVSLLLYQRFWLAWKWEPKRE